MEEHYQQKFEVEEIELYIIEQRSYACKVEINNTHLLKNLKLGRKYSPFSKLKDFLRLFFAVTFQLFDLI